MIFFQRIQRGHEIEIEDFFLLNLKFQFYIFNATFYKLFLFYINKYSIFFWIKLKYWTKTLFLFNKFDKNIDMKYFVHLVVLYLYNIFYLKIKY